MYMTKNQVLPNKRSCNGKTANPQATYQEGQRQFFVLIHMSLKMMEAQRAFNFDESTQHKMTD